VIPGLKGVKTKADAKKAFKAAALRHHPDRGGSEARMKDLNSAWEDFVKSPNYEKLAMVSWASIADKLLNSDRRQ
jgi:curved DNA-binding protein CbpA